MCTIGYSVSSHKSTRGQLQSGTQTLQGDPCIQWHSKLPLLLPHVYHEPDPVKYKISLLPHQAGKLIMRGKRHQLIPSVALMKRLSHRITLLKKGSIRNCES